MKHTFNNRRTRPGFTLIELLVVIAVIAILAALLFPVGGRIMQNAAKKRAQAELNLVAAAIDSYKAKLGYYPPDNARTIGAVTVVNPAVNQLFYELVGCTRNQAGTAFAPLNGSPAVTVAALMGMSGNQINGIMNSSAATGGDDAVAAQSFMKELNPSQYGDAGGVRRLGVTLDGPVMVGNVSPFRYNSSSPTNNPSSYDLWVDIIVGGKTNRVNNWSPKPIVL